MTAKFDSITELEKFPRITHRIEKVRDQVVYPDGEKLTLGCYFPSERIVGEFSELFWVPLISSYVWQPAYYLSKENNDADWDMFKKEAEKKFTQLVIQHIRYYKIPEELEIKDIIARESQGLSTIYRGSVPTKYAREGCFIDDELLGETQDESLKFTSPE